MFVDADFSMTLVHFLYYVAILYEMSCTNSVASISKLRQMHGNDWVYMEAAFSASLGTKSGQILSLALWYVLA